MKYLPTALLLFLFTVPALASELFDLDAISDQGSLETRVIHDWKPNAKDPAMQQKLIEITVCEWWPGQKIRLPVTLNIPTAASAIENVIVANSPLALKTATPRGVELEMLKQHGVGVVLIGMGTIDAMTPQGELHIGMREHLLSSNDVRYTPAWIWGMSQMRALTAAESESKTFRPKKVITTGGSKRGVAAAVAGIHDDRFTAIMPVVAPIVGNPGGSYVIGTDDPTIVAANEKFLADILAGKSPLEPSVKEALDGRNQRRADQRITLQQAHDAGWSQAQIDTITDRAWEQCLIARYLAKTKQRGLDFFYVVGTNDSVSPALLELGKSAPTFPHYIVPGGQHGGPATAGFTTRVPGLDETVENFKSFCLSHFFQARSLPATPEISYRYEAGNHTLEVTVRFTDGSQPQDNQLSWCADRHRPYTLAFEYDTWQNVAIEKTAPDTFRGTIEIPPTAKAIDFLSTHRHIANDLPFNLSSAYQRFTVPSR